MRCATLAIGMALLDVLAGSAARAGDVAMLPAGGAPAPTSAETVTSPDHDDQHQAGQPRRDPFRPFTLDLRPEPPVEPLTPLQQYDLQQLTVTGIVWNMGTPVAIVEDNARMGFIVTPGTLIGRQQGVVKAIEPGRIIVDQRSVDSYGHMQRQQVVMEMPKNGHRSGDAPARRGPRAMNDEP